MIKSLHDKIQAISFHCKGHLLCFRCKKYLDGNAVAVIAECENGAPYTKLTINIPEVELANNELIVKTWGENEHLAVAAMETGLFKDTGKRIIAGFTEAQIWKVVE